MPAARTLRPAAAAALFLLAGFAAPLRAEPKVTWDPARTTSPDTVEELKALQERVKQVVKKDTPSTVGLLVGMGAGSGVIVSDDGLVLTAAHVIGKPGVPLKVVLSDGTIVKGKSLGVNPRTDSGMVRITDKPPKSATWPGADEGKWPAAELGDSADLKKGQWVVALGHPGGPKLGRRPPVRVGRFESYNKSDTALRTDCTLVGGDSGGPLFDLNGKVVGIHSRIGLFLEYNMHVPTSAFREDWDKLLQGQNLGKPPVEIGLAFDPDEEAATVKKVTADGPADKAGLKAGDVILKFAGEKVHSAEDVEQMLLTLEPGQTVHVEVQRGEKTVTVKMTVGRKPGRRKKSDDD